MLSKQTEVRIKASSIKLWNFVSSGFLCKMSLKRFGKAEPRAGKNLSRSNLGGASGGGCSSAASGWGSGQWSSFSASACGSSWRDKTAHEQSRFSTTAPLAQAMRAAALEEAAQPNGLCVLAAAAASLHGRRPWLWRTRSGRPRVENPTGLSQTVSKTAALGWACGIKNPSALVLWNSNRLPKFVNKRLNWGR